MRVPGPALAGLAPAQAITLRAFSPCGKQPGRYRKSLANHAWESLQKKLDKPQSRCKGDSMSPGRQHRTPPGIHEDRFILHRTSSLQLRKPASHGEIRFIFARFRHKTRSKIIKGRKSSHCITTQPAPDSTAAKKREERKENRQQDFPSLCSLRSLAAKLFAATLPLMPHGKTPPRLPLAQAHRRNNQPKSGDGSPRK